MHTDADDQSIGFARLKHLARESEQALDDHSTIHPCEVHHATNVAWPEYGNSYKICES